MLISRWIFIGLLIFVFGCGVSKEEFNLMITDATQGLVSESDLKQEVEAAVRKATQDLVSKEDFKQGVEAAVRKATQGTQNLVSKAELKQEVRKATQGLVSKEDLKQEVEAAVRKATQGLVSKAELDQKVAIAKARETIQLAEQVNFFGFDEETDKVLPEVVAYIEEAKQELRNAEDKLRDAEAKESVAKSKESVMHANTAFKLRAKIAYYSLIRYYYKLGKEYKDSRTSGKKMVAEYVAAKQLFMNAIKIDSKFPLFADTSYYLAKIALDCHNEGSYQPPKEIFPELKKYYSLQGKNTKDLIDKLKELYEK